MEVVITCLEQADIQIRLLDHAAFDEDIASVGVALRAPGLKVDSGAELTDRDGLARFFAGLVEDFTGWTGERTWRSQHDELAVTAVFHSGGRVELRWRVSEQLNGTWSAGVTTWVNAGEDMSRIAADITELLAT